MTFVALLSLLWHSLFAQGIPFNSTGMVHAQGGSAPAFVNAVSNNPSVTGGDASSSSISVTTGNTVFVFFGWDNTCAGSGPFTATDNQSNSYTLTATQDNTFTCANMFRASNVTGNAALQVTVHNVVASTVVLSVVQVSASASSFDQGAIGFSSSSPTTSGNVTTTTAAEILVAGVHDYYGTGSDTITAVSGWTIPMGGTIDGGTASAGQLAVAYKTVSSTGTFNGSFNVTGNIYCSTGISTFK